MANRNVNEDLPIKHKLTQINENEGFCKVQEIQSIIRSMSNCIFNKVPKPRKQNKELIKKQRLKKLYVDYMKSLNLESTTKKDTKAPFISCEAQLKVLLTHQDHRLHASSKSEKSLKPTKKSQIFQVQTNSLLSKLTSLFSSSSKNPSFKNSAYTLSSIFVHAKSKILKRKERLISKLEKNFEEFQEKEIKVRHRKIRKNIAQSVEKILMTRKSVGYFTRRLRSYEDMEGDLSECRSAIRVGSEETRDQSVTGRSSSATPRRLGFFKV